MKIQIGFLNVETANKTGAMNKFHGRRQFNTYYLRWIPIAHNYVSKIILHRGIVRSQFYLSLNGKDSFIIELLVGPLDNFVYENEIVKCRDEFITYQIGDGKSPWKIPGQTNLLSRATIKQCNKCYSNALLNSDSTWWTEIVIISISSQCQVRTFQMIWLLWKVSRWNLTCQVFKIKRLCLDSTFFVRRFLSCPFDSLRVPFLSSLILFYNERRLIFQPWSAVVTIIQVR